jgi:hypothetical protein
LCLNRTLKKPLRTPNITAAALEKATIWLAAPTAALLLEPKKVSAIFTKNKLAITSSMPVPK